MSLPRQYFKMPFGTDVTNHSEAVKKRDEDRQREADDRRRQDDERQRYEDRYRGQENRKPWDAWTNIIQYLATST